MTGVGVIAIHFVIRTHRDLIQCRITIGETIGHDQVKYVGRVKALDLISVRLASLQLIRHLEMLLPLCEGDVKGAGLGIRYVKINQQIVGAL